MLKGSGESLTISNGAVLDWMINEEPNLVKKIVGHFLDTEVEVSFDSEENEERLRQVSDYVVSNWEMIYDTLDENEKLLLYIMDNSFGWIVYDEVDSTINIISHVFRVKYKELRKAVDTLLEKFLIYKYERLKRYNLLFSPPIFLKQIASRLREDIDFEHDEGVQDIQESLPTDQYIGLLSGLISYVVTYSPRSSETNEIHKIDFVKMVDLFSDFAPRERIEQIIKKFSRFGFFEKLNNRIVINRSIMEKILSLSVNEQLFIVFLFDFMDKFDFKKSYFMTLKILANQAAGISLRELFYYYLNNEVYLLLKNEAKNLRVLLQQEELKFTFFLKTLETENIVAIKRKREGMISIATDAVIMNEPHTSLLNNMDFDERFCEQKFIVEANYEVIVEPYLRPDILFKLALMVEPVTIQTISIFKITKESIYRAFAYGIDKNEILEFLREHSRHDLPDNVVGGIENFINNLDIKNMKEYSIIQVGSQDSIQIKDNFKNKVIEVEPHTFLVFDADTAKEIKQFCERKSISMKKIEDFLDGENFFYKMHETALVQNIKHLHSLKEFFDFYGSSLVGTKVKIDNQI